jgi:signal transduction histidine kinase
MNQHASKNSVRWESKIVRRRSPSRSELQQQVTELIGQQAAISEVLRSIASSPNELQPIFESVVANAIRLGRAKVGFLLLFEGGDFRVVARRGPLNRLFKRSPRGFVAPVRPGTPLARLVESKSSVQIADLAADPAYLERDPIVVTMVERIGVRTYLVVPMLKEDELIGAIGVHRELVQPFTDNQIALVAAFAAQAAIALDITRRERLFREVQMELARTNRIATMGQPSSSIAHEITQPITATRNYARAALNFLDQQPSDLGEARGALDCIVAEADRAGDIIDRIRDHINKAPPKMDRFDMNEAIRDAIILTRGEAAKNDVSIQTQLAEGLPFFRGDWVQIQQVMVNLIVNAIQAMSGGGNGGRELQISTEIDDAKGVRVGVRDTGPGLSPNSISRLFDAFYTTKPDGMGMGLSICRRIIEAHGGRIWATGYERRGTLFQFTIPSN